MNSWCSCVTVMCLCGSEKPGASVSDLITRTARVTFGRDKLTMYPLESNIVIFLQLVGLQSSNRACSGYAGRNAYTILDIPTTGAATTWTPSQAAAVPKHPHMIGHRMFACIGALLSVLRRAQLPSSHLPPVPSRCKPPATLIGVIPIG